MASENRPFAQRLAALKIDSSFLNLVDSFPDFNPVDVYRCFISTHLAEITKLDAKVIYPALQWTQTLDKGDLNLAVPRLRVKQGAPDELAKRWAEEVGKPV